MSKYSKMEGYDCVFPNPNTIQDGLTKREYFATHAPQNIPEWFQHQRIDEPQQPKNWYEIKWEKEFDSNTARDWQADGSYDLPEHMQWFQKEWETYREAYRKWQLKDYADRYFQWRTYYAEQMIQQLNVPVPY